MKTIAVKTYEEYLEISKDRLM